MDKTKLNLFLTMVKKKPLHRQILGCVEVGRQSQNSLRIRSLFYGGSFNARLGVSRSRITVGWVRGVERA